MIIKDFNRFVGQHCETTATGSLLKQIGIELPEPPFIATIYEGFSTRYKNSKIFKTWYWIAGIFVASAIVILSYMF